LAALDKYAAQNTKADLLSGVGSGRKAEPVGLASSERENMQLEGTRPLYFAYTRVSTEEQADSRNGLEAQRYSIDAEAHRRGWDVEYFSDEGVTGKSIGPRLREVLGLLASGQGDGLIVSKLDRLSRSIINAANIIESAQEHGWSLVMLDLSLDLTTAAGRMVAHSFMSFAQYERELISERTKAALAAKKARNEPIGRPRLAKPGIVRRIVLDRKSGLSFDRIARALSVEGILSPAGRPTWQSSTVRRIYKSAMAATELAASA
jgi:DNA invertase Pin-like site-specific DNA recombinase